MRSSGRVCVLTLSITRVMLVITAAAVARFSNSVVRDAILMLLLQSEIDGV
jgi:hypothetical protein